MMAVLATWLWSQYVSVPEPLSGTIEVDEVHVGPRFGGRIEKLPHQEGDELQAGEVIAELDAQELTARRALAAAQLEEMEHGPRPSEIEAALKDWESLKAQLAFAEADAKRARALLSTRVVSASEAEKTISNADALAKSAEAARQRYELLREGTRPERIAQARAQLADIDAQLKEMRIVAPGHSILEVLSVKVGDVLAANREVATLILPDHLWIRVYVPATWLGKLHLGQKAELRVDGINNRLFYGTVEQINREAEYTPRNVQTVEDRVRQVFGVKVRLENADGALRAGMSGEVTFPGLNTPVRKERLIPWPPR
ncbi:MAG: efflux RND transporter periplasmic adaptor subunit [Verrucomicrobia bacterium]|nr:efflux RND transporter periplasmic adaptor subunit [Verrucomicrobiota bacterium]